MRQNSEKAFIEKAKQQMDRHAEQLDELTSARLKAVRQTALQQHTRFAVNWLPLSGLATATATAAVFAVVIWYHHPNDMPALAEEWELLAASEELELIEELEFYDWLETTQPSS
jgi:hypothetical protein